MMNFWASTVCLLVALGLGAASSLPKSCKDIYLGLSQQATSGLYTVYTDSGKAIEVFCDFYDDHGYTYLPKAALSQLTDLENFVTEKDHALIQILYTNKEQHNVNVKQLAVYERYPLSFQLNKHEGYKGPVNTALGSYIYLGFLPVEIARLRSSINGAQQGYWTGGADYTFNNCDFNPNSYIAFFANPENNVENPYYKRCCDNPTIRKWIAAARLIPESRYLPADFFYQFEMHLGGCGGYLTSNHVSKQNIAGVAIGLPFAIDKECRRTTGSYCCA